MFPHSCFLLQNACILPFFLLKTRKGNSLQMLAVSVCRVSIETCMFFDILLLKIQIRKLPTIVGCFRIPAFEWKTDVFGVLELKIEIRYLFSSGKLMFFDILPLKIQLWKFPTIVGTLSIPVYHCKRHVFWRFATWNWSTKTTYNCRHFPYSCLSLEIGRFFVYCQLKLKFGNCSQL